MLDSIFIGTSGLQTFSADLKVISNNVANLNTPGFKASNSVFASLYYAGAGDGSGPSSGGSTRFGSGVAFDQAVVNFRSGELRQTGNPLDLNVNGEGLFVTRDKGTGNPVYTRAGQFEFNRDGVLVVRGTERQVMGLTATSAQTTITLDGLRISAPRATTAVKMGGNLSSSATDFNLFNLKVIDAVGGEHALSVNFKPKTGVAGTWVVKITDGTTDVAAGEIQFSNGIPSPIANTLNFTYAPAGVAGTNITLDFSGNVTSFDTGSTSSLAVGSSDGYGVGTLSQISFDADGTMGLSYSNGQNAKGARIALARFDANAELKPQGGSDFTYDSGQGVHIGKANQGGFGSIGSSQIEGSNVDLASEFSDLIVAQRGYQASSRIVSTANELLQDLFDMKGHR
ncbi:flagellar hook protein FlgE [Pelomonas saccharophila]|uniref:Flagellar hook protein FlgE n=1 Tax=Roseateles saccharophilus TaxID=304 RepID=A0ABU1YH70_ROSSA|nr:flagellar hook-basal body complex protein [Roseateles saccharophilus]MDR7268210.1 flagellar hook protein FlgE [Roseateles saccharophilus]